MIAHRLSLMLLTVALLGGACTGPSPHKSADVDDDLLIEKNDPPFMPLRKKRRVERLDLPPDLVRFYATNEGIGLDHAPDRQVRLARLEEVRQVAWEDLHIVSLDPPPSEPWKAFSALRIGNSDTLDEIVYVLSAPGIRCGSIVALGANVTMGPAGEDPFGPGGSLVLAATFDEWIDRMRRDGRWSQTGLAGERGTDFGRRLAELNPRSDYAR